MSENDRPPLTTAGLRTTEGWRPLFANYPAVVLVANSDRVDIATLRAEQPEGALFVFFNKVYKVLDMPFDGAALLVARSGQTGANIAYRREVADVLRFFPRNRFVGVLNLVAAPWEKFSPESDFEGTPTGFLDLNAAFADFYPDDHVPSSGFALAVWLCDMNLPGKIVLAGFSAQRSERWKLFHDHDWTLEQIVERVLVRSGRLQIAGSRRKASMANIAARFPGVSPGDVSVAAAEVLSERLEGTNREIDRLISVTRVSRGIERFLRSLKPKTRKQRLAEHAERGEDG